MIDGNFALSFTTGMAASVNPCGFAMLPAYLSMFLGTSGTGAHVEHTSAASAVSRERSAVSAITRALVVSAAMTLGFLVVFATVGTILRSGTSRVLGFSGWATLAIATVLVAAGVAIIAGWRIPIATPKLNRGGTSGSFPSMLLFGASYAVTSLGCALPLFVNVLFNGAKRHGWVSGLVQMALYAAGMGLVVTALTVSLAVARGGLLQLLRRAMRYVDRAAGVLMIVAGLYLVVYAIEEIKVSRGTIASSRITRTGQSVSDRLVTFLQNHDTSTTAAVLTAIVVAAAAVAILGRRRAADVTGGAVPIGDAANAASTSGASGP